LAGGGGSEDLAGSSAQPTGYGDSPYQCFSAFAGNPLLLSLDRLVDRGYLREVDMACRPEFPDAPADYGGVIQWKFPILAKAATAFFQSAREREDFDRYCRRNAHWLDDFARFHGWETARFR
jgi:4-alpha-glucanotransferase